MQTEFKIETVYKPFVKAKDSIWNIMSDVMLALIPAAAVSYLAYGSIPYSLLLLAIISAAIAEFIFASVFLKKKDTLKDGTAIVTAILLVMTVGPFTPWYVVLFGSAMAVIFGKILWGGAGNNLFNPALIGREFMTVFFPVVMTSGSIWYNKDFLNIKSFDFFGAYSEDSFSSYLDSLIYKPSGAIGEYSVLLLILGGIFLLVRRRISWHIPFGLLVTFTVLISVFSYKEISFSLAGVLLGTIFMATDMPSSASSNGGKLYYGAMIGFVAVICLLNDIHFEYMSYSILLVNGFSRLINRVFMPSAWGMKPDVKKRILQSLLLTILIVLTTFIVILLHRYSLIAYLLYAYIVFIIVRFTWITDKDLIKK